MGSPSPHEWLELGLGLFKTKNNQEAKKQYSLEEGYHENENENENENEEEEDQGLDLRLQIGHNNINTCHFHGLSSPPNSALWFSLRSSPNRNSGAALPQIPKAYIRVNAKGKRVMDFGEKTVFVIRDEKMTVLMVKKYLVTKLSLSSEAEVELWCMGERLVQGQSLKEVRDGVWLPKLVEFVNSNSSFSTSIFHHSFHHHSNQVFFPSSATYLMSLYYGRT